MSITRRQVLTGAAGAAGILAFGSLGQYLMKTVSSKYLQAQMGGFPLVYANKEKGFEACLTLSAVGGVLNEQNVKKNLQNYFYVFFHNPQGQILFQKEFILESFQHELIPLDNLGWGSLLIVSALPDDPKKLAQIDAVSSFSHKTSFGEDGHHLQAIRSSNDRSCHTVITPQKNEERLLSFFNPFPDILNAEIEIFNKHGKKIYSKECIWPKFGTQYFSFAENQLAPKGSHLISALPGEVLFVNIAGKKVGTLLSSSWHYRAKENTFFTQAHGANFKLQEDAGMYPFGSKTLEKLKAAKHQSDLFDIPEVFPGDYVTFSSVDKSANWDSKIYIPNATKRNLNVGIFVAASDGTLIENSFASRGPMPLAPNCVAELKVKDFIPTPLYNEPYVVSCYTGSNILSSYSASKIVSTDQKGRFLYQHFRPHDGEIKPWRYDSYFDSTSNHLTDYWIGNIDFKNTHEIFGLIRNNGQETEDQAKIFYFDEKSYISESSVPKITAHGFIIMPLPMPSEPKNLGIRLVAPKGNLTISVFSKTATGQYSIRHASSKLNKFPNIYNLKKYL